MSAPSPVAVWFEIPASDLERAARFYETLLGLSLRRETMGSARLAVFPSAEGSGGGCVMAGASTSPGADGGTLVYLNADGRLDAALSRLQGAGGALLTPVTELPEGMGRFAHIRDSEGNRVGLHAIAAG